MSDTKYHQSLSANRKLVEEIDRLKAENESLRKAGDALIRICEIDYSNKDEYEIRWNAWQDAKEGRDAK